MGRGKLYQGKISEYLSLSSIYPVIFSFLLGCCLIYPANIQGAELDRAEIRDTLPTNQTRYIYLKKELLVEFQLVMQPGQTYFGRLLQIQSNDNEYFNFFLDYQENNRQLLIYSRENIRKLQIPALAAYTPLSLKLTFYQQQKNFTVRLNDTTYIIDNLGFNPKSGYKFMLIPNNEIGKDLNGKPVFQIEQVHFIEITDAKLSSNFWMWFVFILVIDLIVFGGVQLRKKWLRRKHNVAPTAAMPVEMVVNETELPPVSAVYLFGGFHIYDKAGNNITKKFTPLLKELFLLLVLHARDKGISSGKLKEILWFDKTDQSAKNNRTVNFGKLRGLLDTVGEYDLNNNTGNWILEIKEKSIRVDYLEYMDLVGKGILTERDDIVKLLSLTRRGSFLNDVDYEWLDWFKTTTSDYVIDTLLRYAETLKIAAEPDLILQLAETVSFFDVLNESALQFRVRAYTFVGKHSLAKNSYEKFSKEYLAIYGEKFPRSFSDLR